MVTNRLRVFNRISGNRDLVPRVDLTRRQRASMDLRIPDATHVIDTCPSCPLHSIYIRGVKQRSGMVGLCAVRFLGNVDVLFLWMASGAPP